MADWIQYKRGGKDMKRQIAFEHRNESYILTEAEQILFEIKEETLKFDSAKFYEGVYKGKSIGIDLSCKLPDGSDSIGKYIFNWIKEIINSLNLEFDGIEKVEEEETTETKDSRIIPLFDMPACAGNGFYTDESVSHVNYSTTNPLASYAVKIVGQSMEPTIPDGSIVLVDSTADYEDNDIVIANYNGETICKRYKKLKRGVNLVSDNKSGNFIKINNKEMQDCTLQGKVIDVEKLNDDRI